MSFLEEQDNLQTAYNSSVLLGNGLGIKTTNAVDYSIRYPTVY
jgi:hypothetical protein